MKPRKSVLLFPAALALVVWAVWSPLCRAPFLFDDHVVVEKAAVRADGLFRGLLREPRPLRALTHRLDVAVFGPDDAAGPHAANIALHYLCALLWFALVRRIGRGAGEGAAAAMLFAVLPVCAESLGVVSHRKEMLALAPILGALCLVAPCGGKPKVAGTAGAVALFALAVGGKETALVLPALAALCICESARNGDGKRDGFRPGAWFPVFALAGAGIALAAASWLQVHASMDSMPGDAAAGLGARPGHLSPGTPLARAAVWAAWAVPRYAVRVFSPIGHCLDPATPEGGPGAAAAASGFAFAAVWCGAAAFAFRRRSPFAFPLAWCAAALAPAVFPPLLAGGGLAVLADRYAYADAPGAALLAVTAARRLLRSPRVRIAAAVAAVAAYAAFARGAAVGYAAEDSLWEAVLRCNPRSYLAHHNLAFSAWKRGGDPEIARRHFAEMAEIRPDFVHGLQSYVNFVSERDGSPAALRWLDGRMDAPGQPRAALAKMRGALRSAGGDFAGAEDDLRFALSAGADDSAVRHNLGVALQRQLRWKEAAAQFAVSKDDPRLPDDAALAAALGGTWAQRPVPSNGVSRVVVVGDSVPAGYDSANPGKSKSLAQLLNEKERRERRSGDRFSVRFSNRAVPGSALHALPEKLPVLLRPEDVRFCLVMSGHNDAFAGVPPALLMRDMADCILICRLRGVEPVVLGPIPVRSAGDRDRAAQERTLEAWNGTLCRFCRENGVRFLDVRDVLASDSGGHPERLLDRFSGNHLTEAGMSRLAAAVADLVGLGGP
ncbi:MAG: hypothetical protein IJ783_11055 [Kiritimatiellae bacterium]|nr:hypothetical protein [Kiritimatiellia bacterium]